MAATVRDPPDGRAGLAAAVNGLVPAEAERRGRGRLLRRYLAAVAAHKHVPDLAAGRDGDDGVVDAVLAEEADGLGRVADVVAPAEGPGRERGDGAEGPRTGAGQRARHAGAVAEAESVDVGRGEAEGGRERREQGVDKGDVGAIRVGPAVVDALRGDEDGGGAVGKRLQPVPAVGVDVFLRAVQPVEAEEERMRCVGVVVDGKLQDVGALLLCGVDGQAVRASVEGGR